jgi:hypothetical protein
MTTPSHGAPPDAQTLDSTARLQEIADLGLNDSDIDDILSEITAEAAAHFGLPVALVSIVLDQAQYFHGSHGLDGWMATARGAVWSDSTSNVSRLDPSGAVQSDASIRLVIGRSSVRVRPPGARA